MGNAHKLCRDILSFVGNEGIAGDKNVSTYLFYGLYVKGSRMTRILWNCFFLRTSSAKKA